jgi:MFS transporter, UMF1 family
MSTISSTAILFAKTALNMPPSSLILIGVITPVSGIIGSLAWPFLQRRLSYSNLKMLVILLIFASLIPINGCLGFLPFLQHTKFGGLRSPGEMYAMAIVYGWYSVRGSLLCTDNHLIGFSIGAFQSYARAIYADLIPKGEEARWYGLLSITDKVKTFFFAVCFMFKLSTSRRLSLVLWPSAF